MTSLDTACMTEQAIDEYLSDYTMDGDSEFHMPTDAERLLIKDAITGLLVDQNFIASFAPLTEPELRAGIALQLREIERLHEQIANLRRAMGKDNIELARLRAQEPVAVVKTVGHKGASVDWVAGLGEECSAGDLLYAAPAAPPVAAVNTNDERNAP